MNSKITMGLGSLFHATPYALNWVSLFLVGYATYQPVLMDWVHSAPFGTIEAKDAFMAWLDWLCPALGVLIQFTRRKPEENASEENNQVEG